jgi:hypothetical protein
MRIWIWIRSTTFSSLLQHTKNRITPVYNQLWISFLSTGLFLQGLAEYSCQEMAFNRFFRNTAQKLFTIL